MKKIILNWLPPANIYRPSIALSVLKSHLNFNGIENVEVKYLNVLLDKVYSDYQYSPYSKNELLLLPFLYILATSKNDNSSLNKLYIKLQTQKEYYNLMPLSNSKLEAELFEMKEKIYQILDAEFHNTNFQDILIFGISSKFYQWISGMIIAEYIKSKNQNIKVVLGGMGSKDSAIAYLKASANFDFAIWGEGEVPLVDLYNKLSQEQQDFEDIERIAFKRNSIIETSIKIKNNYVEFSSSPVPDFSDYFVSTSNWSEYKKEQIEIPLESSRGCCWNKCKFCYMNQGYKYREKATTAILNEIGTLRNKYGINKFAFHDNNLAGKDKDRFSDLLDKLIEYNVNNSLKLEIVSSDIIKTLMMKL